MSWIPFLSKDQIKVGDTVKGALDPDIDLGKTFEVTSIHEFHVMLSLRSDNGIVIPFGNEKSDSFLENFNSLKHRNYWVNS